MITAFTGDDWLMRFTHNIIVRAPHLLNVNLSPHELADELGIDARTVRDWVQQGMPHTRDATQHIWINGVEFAGWVSQVRSQRKRVRLGADEAYCMRCKRAVPLRNPRQVMIGQRPCLTSACPTCGKTINRGQ